MEGAEPRRRWARRQAAAEGAESGCRRLRDENQRKMLVVFRTVERRTSWACDPTLSHTHTQQHASVNVRFYNHMQHGEVCVLIGQHVDPKVQAELKPCSKLEQMMIQ